MRGIGFENRHCHFLHDLLLCDPLSIGPNQVVVLVCWNNPIDRLFHERIAAVDGLQISRENDDEQPI